ncbi:MAG: hypothetical protein NUV81_00715 [bacterium]|nr:hypothetical protein [bacterium]
MSKDKKSHIGSSLMLGAVIAVAAASFLQTKRGKVLKQDLKKKMGSIHKKLSTELKKAKSMSQERYEELVDNVIDYYVKTKDVAQSEMPGVKKELMSSWKKIEKEMKSSGKKIATTAKASGKVVVASAKKASKEMTAKKKAITKKKK